MAAAVKAVLKQAQRLTWRATLPFGVEVSTASGIKIYRRVTVG